MPDAMSDSLCDPIETMHADRAAARDAGDALADVCFLATADAAGQPSVRALSLREVGPAGIGITISATSVKWRELNSSGRYELLCLWRSVDRQYRIQGDHRPMPDDVVDQYWRKKRRGSRLLERYYEEVAPQSTPVASREAFLAGVEGLRARYPEPDAVPRPAALLGLRLVPTRVEVWQGSPDRLHHRVVYTRSDERWTRQVLVP